MVTGEKEVMVGTCVIIMQLSSAGHFLVCGLPLCEYRKEVQDCWKLQKNSCQFEWFIGKQGMKTVKIKHGCLYTTGMF